MDVAEVKAKLSGLVSPEVLVDETRMELLKALAVEDMYCAEINVKFPNAGRHLKILEKEGIIRMEKRGFLCFYSLVKPEIADIISQL